jgi:hypothetical protein
VAAGGTRGDLSTAWVLNSPRVGFGADLGALYTPNPPRIGQPGGAAVPHRHPGPRSMPLLTFAGALLPAGGAPERYRPASSRTTSPSAPTRAGTGSSEIVTSNVPSVRPSPSETSPSRAGDSRHLTV